MQEPKKNRTVTMLFPNNTNPFFKTVQGMKTYVGEKTDKMALIQTD